MMYIVYNVKIAKPFCIYSICSSGVINPESWVIFTRCKHFDSVSFLYVNSKARIHGYFGGEEWSTPYT